LDSDQIQQQAPALASALAVLGIADISASEAQAVLVQMGHEQNRRAAEPDSGLDGWSEVQAAIYRGYPGNEALQLKIGQSYAHRDALFTVLMDVAGLQPLEQAIETIEHWASEADRLQMQVRNLAKNSAAFHFQQLVFPTDVDQAFVDFLHTELSETTGSWVKLGSRLETTRWDLYAVAFALRCVSAGAAFTIMLLDSRHGIGGILPVIVPQGMTTGAAQTIASNVLESLGTRENNAPEDFFSFNVGEFKVRLAQAGLLPVVASFVGPIWD